MKLRLTINSAIFAGRFFDLLRWLHANYLAVPALIFLAIFQISVVHAQSETIVSDRRPAIVIDETSDQQVATLSKDVIVNGRAREVFVFGGDVVINGAVSGDVGVIGGNVIQNPGSVVGGDIIVIGGSYRPADRTPNRAPGRETIVFGIFEDELREIGENPASILSPAFSPAFFAQRAISVVFWFIITMIFATIAPGAVGRAVSKLRLMPARVAIYGLGGLFAAVFVVAAGVAILPDYISALVWLMVFIALMLAYLYGRVALQIAAGKRLLKIVSPGARSESASALTGVIFWTLILSLPVLWTLALLTIFAAGIGLVATARRPNA